MTYSTFDSRKVRTVNNRNPSKEDKNQFTLKKNNNSSKIKTIYEKETVDTSSSEKNRK